MKLRLFKMSETDKNMLLVALHIIFKAKRENGEDYNPIGHFILRIAQYNSSNQTSLTLVFLGIPCVGVVSQIKDLDNTPKTENGKLYLNNEEFIWARNALNLLRNQYLKVGRYSDGIDYVMMKLIKSKCKRYKESKAKIA